MPRPLPESLASGAFTYEQATNAGVPRSRLRGHDLEHPHRGLYVPKSLETDVLSHCRSLIPLLGDEQCFSHLTAARIFGCPTPIRWTPKEPVHIIAMSDAAPMRRSDVIGWETEVADLPRRFVSGIPVVAPADAWCQLAVRGGTGIDSDGRKRNLNHDLLVAVADYLLTGPRRDGKHVPVCTRSELLAAIARRAGRRGVKALRDAIEQARYPVHSPKETILRLAIVESGLPEPEVQVPVRTAQGLRHSDLGYSELKLLFEYQGDHHRTDRKQWLEDLTRIQLFEDAGYRTMLIGADDVTRRNLPALLARITRARETRARETSRMSL